MAAPKSNHFFGGPPPLRDLNQRFHESCGFHSGWEDSCGEDIDGDLSREGQGEEVGGKPSRKEGGGCRRDHGSLYGWVVALAEQPSNMGCTRRRRCLDIRQLRRWELVEIFVVVEDCHDICNPREVAVVFRGHPEQVPFCSRPRRETSKVTLPLQFCEFTLVTKTDASGYDGTRRRVVV